MLISVLIKTREKYVINKINVVKTNKHSYIQYTYECHFIGFRLPKRRLYLTSLFVRPPVFLSPGCISWLYNLKFSLMMAEIINSFFRFKSKKIL